MRVKLTRKGIVSNNSISDITFMKMRLSSKKMQNEFVTTNNKQHIFGAHSQEVRHELLADIVLHIQL